MVLLIMTKIESGPNGGYLFPHPVTLISAYDKNGKANAFATCWIMNIGHKPPKLAFVTREHRYTYNLFKESGFFGINVPSAKIVNEVDFFGCHSGKDLDKFAATKLTFFEGTKAKIPLITECHVNLECKIIETHPVEETMIIIFAEVINSHYDKELFGEDKKLDESRAQMMVYGIQNYWGAFEKIGTVGMSKQDKK